MVPVRQCSHQAFRDHRKGQCVSSDEVDHPLRLSRSRVFPMRTDEMLASARHLEPLPQEHPCRGCEVRHKAICGVLDCGRLNEFRRLASDLRLARGQTLFHEGDPATRVFTLTWGSL